METLSVHGIFAIYGVFDPRLLVCMLVLEDNRAVTRDLDLQIKLCSERVLFEKKATFSTKLAILPHTNADLALGARLVIGQFLP